MVLSMTGFGAAEGDLGTRRVRVEIRTVNHRFFNLSIRLPSELGSLEAECREALRRDFERGHLSVSVRWTEGAVAGTVTDQVDWERAGQVVEMLRAVTERFALAGEVTAEMVMRHSDVVRRTVEEAAPDDAWAQLAPIVAAAAMECRTARLREGAVLAADLGARLDGVSAEAALIKDQMGGRLVRERDRLRANVAQLIDGRSIDDQRLAHELAMMADRVDIAEELVRLDAHATAARDALARGGPVGKALGFLAQEIGREVNTIGSKANDATIAHHVVAMKGELEKFREQLENVE
ncbi:MAG: YicC family protein [Gemmatimonadales bacterium]|nr:YicC family protein [Gemmatimonadales bacterium]